VLVVEGIIMCGCISQQVCGVTEAMLQGDGSSWTQQATQCGQHIAPVELVAGIAHEL
jgi:hypothetical protein